MSLGPEVQAGQGDCPVTARTIAHILKVKTSRDFCADASCCVLYRRRTSGEGAPCTGHVDRAWEVTCPYEGQYNVDGRDCTTWRECDCLLSDDARDDLYGDGEGPCPTSPVGTHHYIGNADIFPGIPVQGCWPNCCSCTDDHVEAFQEKYGDGTWFVLIAPPEDCDEGMEFVPLARLED